MTARGTGPSTLPAALSSGPRATWRGARARLWYFEVVIAHALQ